MKVKAIWILVKSAVSEWTRDGAPRLGAALSYYTVFALPPLFVIAIFVASLWFDEHAVRQELFDEIGGLIGRKGADALQSALRTVSPGKQGLVAGGIAVGTLVLTATGLFLELQSALNTVWGVRPKAGQVVSSFIKNRLLSFAMVLGIGFLLIVSLIMSTVLTVTAKYLGNTFPALGSVLVVANSLGSLLILTCLFAMIYKWLPDVRISWKDVWVGAFSTAVLFTVGKLLLGLYLGRNAAVSAYGAAGSVVLILLWVYYSAQILLFGAEITQVYTNQFGSRLEPKPHAEWILPGQQSGAHLKPHVLRDAENRTSVLLDETEKQLHRMRRMEKMLRQAV